MCIDPTKRMILEKRSVRLSEQSDDNSDCKNIRLRSEGAEAGLICAAAVVSGAIVVADVEHHFPVPRAFGHLGCAEADNRI